MPEYALILLLVLIVGIFLQFKFKLKIYSSKKHMALYVLTIFLIALVWDAFAITRGHWSFGEQYLLGIRFGVIPLEEIMYFFIFPYGILVIYKLIGKYFSK